MSGTYAIVERRSQDRRLMLFLASALATSPDADLEASARRMQAEVNESPTALQGPQQVDGCDAHGPREHLVHTILRPGSAEEYRHSAMVGWRPLR